MTDSAKYNSRLFSRWLSDRKFYSKNLLKNQKIISGMGKKKSINLFHTVAKKVPAYRDFLKKSKINPNNIVTFKDFQQLPLITKENYISKYSVDERCWNGEITNNHLMSTSSGTTGKSQYWPRDFLAEIEGAYQHEYIFQEILKTKAEKTLFINGFAMGNWIAGTFTQACVGLVALKGYPITCMSPGYNADTVIELLHDLPRLYESVVISGHTPFLKELVEKAKKEGVKFDKIKTVLLGTGQGVTENWREYIVRMLGSNDYYRSFINLYGSADAALMGFESPLSIYLRKFISDNPDKIKELFDDERLPSIYQFDPRLTFIEQQGGELVITKYSGAPLIRYNIHDKGNVVSFNQMLKGVELEKTRTNLEKDLNYKLAEFPFVYLFGREKFMVKIYGANVYTEHVQTALNHKSLQKHLSGEFFMEVVEDKSHNSKMVCRIELSVGASPPTTLFSQKVGAIFVREVKKLNSEYRFVHNELRKKVEPKIILYKYGNPKYFPKGKVGKTA